MMVITILWFSIYSSLIWKLNMMNITYASWNAVTSVLPERKIHFVKKLKKKKKRAVLGSSPWEKVLYTGSVVCKDGWIYEHFPENIYHESIRLHVYFIPSLKSQWPVDGQWGHRLLIKESNCWSCILRTSKELEVVLAKFCSC